MNAASFAEPGSSVPCGGLGASRRRSGEGGGRIRTPRRSRSLCDTARAPAGPGAASWMTNPRGPPRPSSAALLSKCLVLPRAGLDRDQAAGEDAPHGPPGDGGAGEPSPATLCHLHPVEDRMSRLAGQQQQCQYQGTQPGAGI